MPNVFQNLHINHTMTKELQTILLREMEPLRVIYLHKIETFATAEFQRLEKMWKWDDADWCKFFGIEPELRTIGGRTTALLPRGFFSTSNSRKYDRMRSEISKAMTLGMTVYVSHAVKAGERHYQLSIEKLAFRIAKKGLNVSQLSAVTSSVGVNINCTLTDGVKTIRCFTIVAGGPIQQPHYRYLIK